MKETELLKRLGHEERKFVLKCVIDDSIPKGMFGI
jgi:hypothetical protein